MKIAIITGAAGLIGSECVRYFYDKFDLIHGIDNDSRGEFFGKEASVEKVIDSFTNGDYPNYRHALLDITNGEYIEDLFQYYGDQIELIIHTAAQPSHDWAATNPHRDFEVNALGTLNLLESYRKYCPKATFIFTSTNKVYGDRPNFLLNQDTEGFYGGGENLTRYEVEHCKRGHGDGGYVLFEGFNEDWPVDRCKHSLFGVSKLSADLMVQEYGLYFGLNTGVFRGGCLTGPGHRGAEQHGFLSYLIKCIKHGIPYTIYGYKGKQVRDLIHSYDVATIFDEFRKDPMPGEVYNIGGGRHSNCSIIEAICIIEHKLNKKAILRYSDEVRKGDHQWYITDMSKFKHHYPKWNYKYSLDDIIDQIIKSA
jgi:CDP-paratose 2-epimerase